MDAKRLEAFTDGVVAIIITIMVLELKVPHGGSLADLVEVAPVMLAYLLSFINVGLYWNNHHHLFKLARRIDGRVLWANLGLLFWLSLVPFVIRWLDESGFSVGATAAYGVVLGMAGAAYFLVEWALIACNGPKSAVARALGSHRKDLGSLLLYMVAVPLAFWNRWAAIAIYVAIAAIWLVPDNRIAREMDE